MIHFARPEEPAHFDERVRAPGRRFLESRRRRGALLPYWRRVLPELEAGFRGMCAYTAMWLGSPGTVDHFVPTSRDRRLAYEWSNYRYAVPWINSSKQDLAPEEILDPHEVENGWFEVILPSCQLVMTEACPPEKRRQAETMLRRLQLQDGENVLRYRRAWLKAYREGELSLALLKKMAPLVAWAVMKEAAEARRAAAEKRGARKVDPPSERRRVARGSGGTPGKPRTGKGSSQAKGSGRTGAGGERPSASRGTAHRR